MNEKSIMMSIQGGWKTSRPHFTCLLAFLLVFFTGSMQVFGFEQSANRSGELSLNMQQSIPISGVVSDAGTGELLPGVSVVIKGTDRGTVTDFNGNYSINVDDGTAVLVFSFVGYITQELVVGDRRSIDVALSPTIFALDELVVIGYGTQRRGEVTSAIVSIRAEDFAEGKIGDATDLIRGKVAGLSITSISGDPNAVASTRIRGINTVVGGVGPLILVDGIAAGLTTVAPENIASIDVLKDASAAAIYGTRGANGVILITTKSGRRNMPIQATFSSYASLSEWYKVADFMTAEDIRAGYNPQFPDDGHDTDWLGAVTQTGYAHNHSFSLLGGSEMATYGANFTYFNEEGILRKSDRNDLKMQLDYNQSILDEMLRFNFNLLFNRHQNTNNNNLFAYRQAVIRNPTSTIYADDGSYIQDRGRLHYWNPVAIQNEFIGDTRRDDMRMRANITFEPIRNWQTELMLSRVEVATRGQNFWTGQNHTQFIAGIRGAASKSLSNHQSNNVEIISRYNFSIGESRISALGGYSYLYTVNDGFSAGNQDFPSETFLFNNLTTGTFLTGDRARGTASMGSFKNSNTLIGFFGRVSYSYSDRFNLFASVRHEGSSRFGKGNKWGTFPAAGLGWTISNEEFLENVPWLNILRLRSGYGVTGVIPGSDYLSMSLFIFDTWGRHLTSDGRWLPSLAVSQNPNPHLKWETTREWNIGLDWAVFEERLGGTVDLYSRKTVDMLYSYRVPNPPNIFANTMANAGQMTNRGIEVMLEAVPVRTRDFEWSSIVTLAHNENKLVSLENELYTTATFVETGGVGEPVSVPTHFMEVGHRLGDFWGLRSVGVSPRGFVWVQVMEAGQWVVREFETRHNRRENRQRLGTGHPTVFAGWNNVFRYRNFDLNLQFTGQFGFMILNTHRMFYENNSIVYNRLRSARNLHGAVDANGEPVIDTATGKQLMVPLSSTMPQGFWSDHLEKGDFVKLRNVTLGYTFPLSGSGMIRNLRVYLSGQNLFTFSGYTGLDPEVSAHFTAPGIDDRDKYPTIRSFTFGLSANF